MIGLVRNPRTWESVAWTGSDAPARGAAVTRSPTEPNNENVHRPKDATGFVVLPRRWVVERTLAWLMHARRHARDYERLVQQSEALITWAAITLMTRRIAHQDLS